MKKLSPNDELILRCFWLADVATAASIGRVSHAQVRRLVAAHPDWRI